MHLQRSMQQCTFDLREGRDARQVLNKDGALGDVREGRDARRGLNKDGALGKFPQVRPWRLGADARM